MTRAQPDHREDEDFKEDEDHREDEDTSCCSPDPRPASTDNIHTSSLIMLCNGREGFISFTSLVELIRVIY